MAAQLPPSDEELGLFADQHDPDFSLYGEKLPKSSDNVLKALGTEVVVPITHFHPSQAVAASNLLSPAMATAPGVPPGHQVPLHLRPAQLQVQSSATFDLPSPAMATAPGVPPGHQVPLHLRPGQLLVQHTSDSNLRSPAMVTAPGVPPGHQVSLHLRPGQLQVQSGAGGSATRQLSRASPITPPGHQFHPAPLHLRPGHLQGVSVRSGPMRSPAPVVHRPPVPHQPDQMLRTIHVSPIPIDFHDTLQFKLQIEQLFGIHTVEECKLPIQHKGYGFVTFYTKETFDSAISRRTINLNLRQGTEADALSLKPALRR